ncbi:sigma-70 family RNA polymerase sigma factor [Ruegeria profundi]|uniref:sigma-70 family RNA polymerase sigma factor n=1 Tax=Ruegeria profundi TaxID=1685378 RepID=UPI001CD5C208|nr:sigma-70 family RNA polymerase sigma factor [Ruegeria profundi]MCA0929274.1 sigma-70 family RNA polymerase sigma factor [Ruegeria profundi]
MTRSHTQPGDRAFVDLQPRLLAVAYRMLGSVSDAEDIVQDAYLRWQRVDVEKVRDETGYLIRVVTRLCLDHLRAARAIRDAYPGEWLPEPLVTDDATERLDRDVSVALMMTLERLSPLERAAFLLHDVFECSYDDLSKTLERSHSSCRQLVSRARKHIEHMKPRARVDREHGQELANAFFSAAKTGNTKHLTDLLSRDVQLHSDGGGKIIATLNPIVGRDKVVRFFAGLSRKPTATQPAHWVACQLNGLPAIINREPGGTLQATLVNIEKGEIAAIYMVRNPDKTRHLESVMSD